MEANRLPNSKDEELEYGREKTPEERRESLPPFLRFTDEQIEKHRADNARALAESNSPFIRTSPLEAQRARAIREEEDWRRSLHSLDFAIKTGDDAEETRARYDLAAQTLAENLATQGRYDEAAALTPSEDQKREYLQIHHAILRPDDEWCDEACDARFENDPSRLTREDVVLEVYSIAHARHMPLNRCPYCRQMNVRRASADNLTLKNMRTRARAITEGQTPARAAETLRREKITSAEVFKT